MGRDSPSKRSLKYLRDNGYTAQVVERWNSFARVRQDLFGFIDIVAIRRRKIIGVQTTSYSNMSARKRKILDSSDAYEWILAKGLIHIHGWHKKKNRWTVRIVKIRRSDFLG